MLSQHPGPCSKILCMKWNNRKGKPFKIIMVPLIQSAHVYWCILYYSCIKRLFHHSSFPVLFSNGKQSSGRRHVQGRECAWETWVVWQWDRQCGREICLLWCLMLVASTALSAPPSLWKYLFVWKQPTHFALKLQTLFFFLISTHHSNSLKRRKSSNGSFFSLLQTQGMKRLKRSLQVNSEMWRLHIFIFN